ncbi:uncharacterized protein LOC124368478 [Homalodisca vitripennis]|uniref:uncharacterized protein LOC124368478 n=1 Tax=Homalodisca vitripennis TaxID=197043 RepID=UPI001EEC4A98|nr:uncharacterized protein LOC124368478 [Homalodisca vitripennis]
MMFKKLIFFCLVVAIVRSDTTEEVSSSIDTSPTTSSIENLTLEELKKHGANPKNKGISLRSSDSLFGLGIGANLLGVHAGAGIGHGRGGYGDMGPRICWQTCRRPIPTISTVSKLSIPYVYATTTILPASSSSTPVNVSRNATIDTSNVLPSLLHIHGFQFEISLNMDLHINLTI